MLTFILSNFDYARGQDSGFRKHGAPRDGAVGAVAENHMSESGDGDNMFGDISGNKCLSSSERMEMDYGPCGKPYLTDRRHPCEM